MPIENAYQTVSGDWMPYEGSLRDVRIPDGARVVGGETENTFTSDEVRTVWMPDSVKVVGAKAFENCPNLKAVRFSKNLECIRLSAFNNCTALRSVELPGTLKRIESWAFSGTGIDEIRYAGTMDEFKRIDKTEGEQAWINRTPVVRCTDGDIRTP